MQWKRYLACINQIMQHFKKIKSKIYMLPSKLVQAPPLASLQLL